MGKKTAGSRREEQRGAALVEFALTLPFLILLIMGAFDFGWAVYINNSMAIAAREGARKSIVGVSSTGGPTVTNDMICNQARRGLQGLTLNCIAGAPTDNTTPGIFINPGAMADRGTGKVVQVTVRYIYMPITPVIAPFARSGFMLSSSASMVVE